MNIPQQIKVQREFYLDLLKKRRLFKNEIIFAQEALAYLNDIESMYSSGKLSRLAEDSILVLPTPGSLLCLDNKACMTSFHFEGYSKNALFGVNPVNKDPYFVRVFNGSVAKPTQSTPLEIMQYMKFYFRKNPGLRNILMVDQELGSFAAQDFNFQNPYKGLDFGKDEHIQCKVKSRVFEDPDGNSKPILINRFSI